MIIMPTIQYISQIRSYYSYQSKHNLNPEIYKSFSLRLLSGALGAEIKGLNLSNELNLEQVTELKRALQNYLVLTFPNQSIDPRSHLALARYFGETEPHPIVQGIDGYPDILQITKEAGAETKFGEVWHSDNSYLQAPTKISILIACEVPPFGNDTLFANMHLAFESLSPEMRKMLEGLRAIHTAREAFSISAHRVDNFVGKSSMKYEQHPILSEEISHPVVRTHPETYRKLLFVNSMFTHRFDGMTVGESKPLLTFLFEHLSRPEFTCRVRWENHQVTIWDNRSTQHLAINDNCTHKRVMRRVSVKGDVPF